MNINDARAVIRDQMQPVPDLGELESTAILTKIQEIFNEFPELKKDSELMKEIYEFSVERGGSKTAEVGREFIFSCLRSKEGEIEIFEDLSYLSNKDRDRMTLDLRTSPNRFDAKSGVLVLVEEKPINRDQLWNFVEKHPVKELVVRLESGSSITYSCYMLDELVEKRPDVKALTEMITVKFEGEIKFELPRAKLLLCGDYFDSALSGRWNVSTIQTQTGDEGRCFDLKGTVHLETFSRIVDIIETGHFDLSLLKNEGFVGACNFLSFSPPDPIPENALGPDQWMEHFGDVGDVPPLPPDLQVGEHQLLVLIPRTVNGKRYCLDELKRLLDSKEDPAMKFQYYDNDVKALLGGVSPTKSYWVVMDKDVMGESLNLSRADQKKMMEAKDCRLPKLLEAATAIMMHYAVTGERIFGNDPFRYTCCRELWEGCKTIVGGFSPSGLSISDDSVERSSVVGVASLQEV